MADNVARIRFPVKTQSGALAAPNDPEALGVVTQLVVKSMALAAPPAAPTYGDAYVIPIGATGAWASYAGYLTFYHGGWQYLLPLEGWELWDINTLTRYNYTSGAWSAAAGSSGRQRGAGFINALVALTDAATIATDASLGSYFNVTLNVAGATRQLGNPTNPMADQLLRWRITQDGSGSRALTFGSKFRFGTDLTAAAVVLTATAGKSDYLSAIYYAPDDRYDVIAFLRGF